MIKKIISAFIILICLSQSVLAYDYANLNLEFFNKFNDDNLNYYINSALENNHELKKTEYVIEQYRQQVKYSFSKELPTFSVGANYLGIHTPKFGSYGLSDNAFVLPFVASYEADFLLKNRDKTKSYKKSYEAATYEQKAVYLSLLSDLATVYTNILQYENLISNQRKIVSNNEKILLHSQKLFNHGIISTSELNNSKKQVEDSKAQLNKLEKEQKILLIQLAILSGISPANYNDFKYGNLNNFEYSGTIPDEIASDIIFSRPDVMAAEAKLEKAKIDIRVARKEFFPRFNITGVWAFNTIFPGNFFSWESSLALLLAGATQDIFQGGRKVANLRFQKAKYEELFEDYKQTDLNAIKEVNTALCFVKYDTNTEKNVRQKLSYQNTNFQNEQKKYNRGIISAIEILESENQKLAVENELTKAKTQKLINYFTLYKAVGGKL